MGLLDLPERLLDSIVAPAVDSTPACTTAVLSSCSRLRSSTLRAIFTVTSIPDDARYMLQCTDKAHLPSRRGPVAAFVTEPSVYGPYVNQLEITNPSVFLKVEEGIDLFRASNSDAAALPSTPIPLSDQLLYDWLRCMPNLRVFEWTSSGLPPDGLCEVLARCNKALRAFAYIPNSSVLPSQAEVVLTAAATRTTSNRWDAPSLPHLSQLIHLHKLTISNLSQSGAHSLSHLLRLCAVSESAELLTLEDAGIHELSVDVLWFDEELCEAIALLDRLGKLTIGTAGTTLRDRGLKKMLDGCVSLRCLTLQDVEGRISRSFWSSATLPPSLTSLTVFVSESGPHHSWAVDHIPSVSNLPLSELQTLRILRITSPLSLLGTDAPMDDVARWPGSPIPQEVVEALNGPIRVLQCDWWVWKLDDLRSMLERCPCLEVLKVALDAPFNKIFTLIPALGALRNLRVISLSIPSEHLPQSPVPKDASIWCPPSPITPVLPYSPVTPNSSPKKKGAYTTLRPLEPLTPPIDNSLMPSGSIVLDPALPSLRDIKKLAKKCEKLELLEWYGHDGRGSWSIERDPLIRITHKEPPGPTQALIKQLEWEQAVDAAGWKPSPRVGQEWTRSAWLKEELEKEEEQKREKERDVEREKQRERDRAEKKREQERQKKESALPSSVSPASPQTPAEERLRRQFPLPAASRGSNPKTVKSGKQETNKPVASNASKASGSASQGPWRRDSARSDSARGTAEGSKLQPQQNVHSSGQARRPAANAAKGSWRARGKTSARGPA